MNRQHILSLSPLQVEILLETVKGFVDNKKLLHVPDAMGDTIALPLTEEALQHILVVMSTDAITEKHPVTIEMEQINGEKSNVHVSVKGHSYSYEVMGDEFDPV